MGFRLPSAPSLRCVKGTCGRFAILTGLNQTLLLPLPDPQVERRQRIFQELSPFPLRGNITVRMTEQEIVDTIPSRPLRLFPFYRFFRGHHGLLSRLLAWPGLGRASSRKLSSMSATTEVNQKHHGRESAIFDGGLIQVEKEAIASACGLAERGAFSMSLASLALASRKVRRASSALGAVTSSARKVCTCEQARFASTPSGIRQPSLSGV